MPRAGALISPAAVSPISRGPVVSDGATVLLRISSCRRLHFARPTAQRPDTKRVLAPPGRQPHAPGSLRQLGLRWPRQPWPSQTQLAQTTGQSDRCAVPATGWAHFGIQGSGIELSPPAQGEPVHGQEPVDCLEWAHGDRAPPRREHILTEHHLGEDRGAHPPPRRGPRGPPATSATDAIRNRVMQYWPGQHSAEPDSAARPWRAVRGRERNCDQALRGGERSRLDGARSTSVSWNHRRPSVSVGNQESAIG